MVVVKRGTLFRLHRFRARNGGDTVPYAVYVTGHLYPVWLRRNGSTRTNYPIPRRRSVAPPRESSSDFYLYNYFFGGNIARFGCNGWTGVSQSKALADKSARVVHTQQVNGCGIRSERRAIGIRQTNKQKEPLDLSVRRASVLERARSTHCTLKAFFFEVYLSHFLLFASCFFFLRVQVEFWSG